MHRGFKPISHCDAKTLALGPRVGLDSQGNDFALSIQTFWYLKTQENCVTLNTNPEICITPNAKPQHESVEYRWRWVADAKILHLQCRFHVVYPVFFALGTQHELCSQWNMAFMVTKILLGGRRGGMGWWSETLFCEMPNLHKMK